VKIEKPLTTLYNVLMHGAPIEAETRTAMPSDFLQQQMVWREALDDADGETAVRRVIDQVARAHGALVNDLARLLDQEYDYPAAAKQVRQLLFLDKLQRDFAQRANADDRPSDRADELLVAHAPADKPIDGRTQQRGKDDQTKKIVFVHCLVRSSVLGLWS